LFEKMPENVLTVTGLDFFTGDEEAPFGPALGGVLPDIGRKIVHELATATVDWIAGTATCIDVGTLDKVKALLTVHYKY
jgi:hypothetical protein